MQLFKEEILRAATTILVALRRYTDEHGREYPTTVEASQSMEDGIDGTLASIESDRGTAPQHPPRRPNWRRQMYLAWYTAVAQTQAALLQTSNALDWACRAFHRLGYAVGEHLPANFPACHACGRRELDTECRFTPRFEVICYACLHGVIERANRGRGPEEPNFTGEMVEELLSLAELSEWRRRADDDEQVESERMRARVRRFRTIMRSDEFVRRRWLTALAPVVRRLRVFEEIRIDERNLGEESVSEPKQPVV